MSCASASILQKWPGLEAVFIEYGLKALTNPAALSTFARNVTIGQASKLHKVDLEKFLASLNDGAEKGVKAAPVSEPAPQKEQEKAETAMAKGKRIAVGETAVADTLIGSLIETYPETKVIFEKHYGAGCFSCPGQAFETLAQTAMMHGIKTDDILEEVNDTIKNVIEKGE